MMHIPADLPHWLPLTRAADVNCGRLQTNREDVQARYTGGLFSTICLILVAMIILMFCSCRGPLHSSIPCCPPGSLDMNSAYGAEENAMPTYARAGGAAYASLPPSAYSGPATGPGEAPSPQPGMEQGPPLPIAAYLPWTPPGIRPPWPEDEWLRDGGDCGVPVGVSDGAAGLQMENTLAVYNTIDGRTLVTPSNDVYIYSPRFAAVRQVVGLVLNEQRDRSSDVQLNTSAAAPTVVQKLGRTKQQVQLEDRVSARPAHAFRMKQGDGALSSEIGPRGFQNGFKPYENISVVRNGTYVNSEMMMLARGRQAAVAWSHEQAVQIILDLKGTMAAVKDEQVGTIYTVDEPPGNPKLRIVKLASTPYALPGEEVWFTLRFDNVGNQTIKNVTIIDSLTTRLEYVDGSAQCSRDARFSTEPNEGGSLVFRCELAQPLEVGKGGLIRFCCRVR
jgi:uncharacterized repeat protein (TIGR01451 family)